MSNPEKKSRLRNPFHNPFPASLGSEFSADLLQLSAEKLMKSLGECRKAAAIVDSVLNPLLVGDGETPSHIMSSARVRSNPRWYFRNNRLTKHRH